MKTTLLSFALTALGACTAWAGSICPAGSFPHVPDAAATGCNVVITINADRSVTVQITDPTPYEFAEDILVGVKNNSSTPVTSLGLTGTIIFGLDGDGICTVAFTGNGYCTASQLSGTDPQDYYGPTSTFSITNANSGTVNFNPGLGGGGSSTFFSLEGVPSANLAVVVGGGGAPAAAGVPIGTTPILMLTGTLLILMVWFLRKRTAY